MTDQVTARDKSEGSFTPHSEGQFAAVCVDVVDLGQRVEQWPGSPDRIVDKCAIVFGTDSEGETKDIASEFSLSMHEKAKLRKFLEAWRGKSYTDEQAKQGVPLDKLVRKGALISVEHKTSGKGRKYAVIATIAPLPKQMDAPASDGYERPKFWAERKTQYAEEAKKWAASQMTAKAHAEPEDDDDSDIGF